MVMLALLVRVLFHHFYDTERFNDTVAYVENGQLLWESGTVNMNNIMPLYPLWSYLSDYLFGFPLLDIVISSMTCFLLFKLAIILTGSLIAGNMAAFIFALYPFSVFYSISGLTETLFVFTTILSFIYLYQQKIWLASALMVVGVLIRPSFDFANPVIIALFGYIVCKKGILKTCGDVGKYAIVYILLMLPWWIFNYNRYNQFVRLNLGAGIVLYAGNNPMNTTGGGLYTDYNASAFNAIKDPVLQNQAMIDSAVTYIFEHPKRFAELAVLKFFRFWRVWPHHEYYSSMLIKIVSVISFLPVLTLFILFLLHSHKGVLIKSLPILFLFIYLTGIHVITVGSLRYRFPLEPFMILFSAICLSRWKIITRYT